MNMKPKNSVEEIFAEAAGLTPEQHKNVLGDKWKYINAINEKLIPAIAEKIRVELEREFGHEPSQRILAIVDGKKWDNFWKGILNVIGKRS